MTLLTLESLSPEPPSVIVATGDDPPFSYTFSCSAARACAAINAATVKAVTCSGITPALFDRIIWPSALLGHSNPRDDSRRTQHSRAAKVHRSGAHACLN